MTNGRATEVNAAVAGLNTHIVAHDLNLCQRGPARGDSRIRSNPTFPTTGTRADELLHLFHAGRDGIVHVGFLVDVGSWRLADAVWKLREAGWSIKTHLIGRRRVGAYSLAPAQLMLFRARWGSL